MEAIRKKNHSLNNIIKFAKISTNSTDKKFFKTPIKKQFNESLSNFKFSTTLYHNQKILEMNKKGII